MRFGAKNEATGIVMCAGLCRRKGWRGAKDRRLQAGACGLKGPAEGYSTLLGTDKMAGGADAVDAGFVQSGFRIASRL